MKEQTKDKKTRKEKKRHSNTLRQRALFNNVTFLLLLLLLDFFLSKLTGPMRMPGKFLPTKLRKKLVLPTL